MYKQIKIIYWVICFLFLLVFYRWMMPNWWVNMAASVVNVALFIVITESFIHWRAVPAYFRRGKYNVFTAAVLLCIFLNGLATLFATWFIIQPFSQSQIYDLFWKWENLIYGNFFVVAAFTAVSLTTKLMFDWIEFQKKVRELESEKTRAELDFLKAQLNPHFLFNSLNSIYGHIDKRNAEARRLLLQFADLLRYQLYECGADFIPVEKEVEYLESYIDVQKQRKSEKTKIELTLSGTLSGYEIAPLLFIPLVENAFKFLSSHNNGEENYISIELNGSNDALRFCCINSKDNNNQIKQSYELAKSGGKGIENIRRRLELIYPGKHLFSYGENGSQFVAEVVIKL